MDNTGFIDTVAGGSQLVQVSAGSDLQHQSHSIVFEVIVVFIKSLHYVC